MLKISSFLNRSTFDIAEIKYTNCCKLILMLYTLYYFGNLIQRVGSGRVGALETNGSHQMICRSWQTHDWIKLLKYWIYYIPTQNNNNKAVLFQ